MYNVGPLLFNIVGHGEIYVLKQGDFEKKLKCKLGLFGFRVKFNWDDVKANKHLYFVFL